MNIWFYPGSCVSTWGGDELFSERMTSDSHSFINQSVISTERGSTGRWTTGLGVSGKVLQGVCGTRTNSVKCNKTWSWFKVSGVRTANRVDLYPLIYGCDFLVLFDIISSLCKALWSTWGNGCRTEMWWTAGSGILLFFFVTVLIQISRLGRRSLHHLLEKKVHKIFIVVSQ